MSHLILRTLTDINDGLDIARKSSEKGQQINLKLWSFLSRGKCKRATRTFFCLFFCLLKVQSWKFNLPFIIDFPISAILMFAVAHMAASGAISIATKQIDQTLSNFVVIKVNVGNHAKQMERNKMLLLLLFQLRLYYC